MSSIELFSACFQSSSARCSALCSSLISCAVAGCATVAEVRKRGDDFWGEFEFYLSDLVVGCVLDCVLVGLLAPAAIIGAKPKTKPTGHTHVMSLHQVHRANHLLLHGQLPLGCSKRVLYSCGDANMFCRKFVPKVRAGSSI